MTNLFVLCDSCNMNQMLDTNWSDNDMCAGCVHNRETITVLQEIIHKHRDVPLSLHDCEAHV